MQTFIQNILRKRDSVLKLLNLKLYSPHSACRPPSPCGEGVLSKMSFSFHFRQQDYLFQLKRNFFLLCCGLFVLCCWLGVWQLHRYAEKKILLHDWQQQLHAAPVSFHAGIMNVVPFEHVKATGYYQTKLTVLIPNKIYQNKIGYEVLTPFRMPGDNKLLLIDRGWLGNKPSETTIKEQQEVTGQIKLLNERQFILGNNIMQPTMKPLEMQKIDIAELEQVTGQRFYPFILRLDPTESHGFVRDWIVTTMLPERHMAYAVQWFALAGVLFIAFLFFCCEKVEKPS